MPTRSGRPRPCRPRGGPDFVLKWPPVRRAGKAVVVMATNRSSAASHHCRSPSLGRNVIFAATGEHVNEQLGLPAHFERANGGARELGIGQLMIARLAARVRKRAPRSLLAPARPTVRNDRPRPSHGGGAGRAARAAPVLEPRSDRQRGLAAHPAHALRQARLPTPAVVARRPERGRGGGGGRRVRAHAREQRGGLGEHEPRALAGATVAKRRLPAQPRLWSSRPNGGRRGARGRAARGAQLVAAPSERGMTAVALVGGAPAEKPRPLGAYCLPVVCWRPRPSPSPSARRAATRAARTESAMVMDRLTDRPHRAMRRSRPSTDRSLLPAWPPRGVGLHLDARLDIFLMHCELA